MKKIILTLFIVSQSMMVFAEKPKVTVRVKNDNVKMYQQPGTASNLLKSLSTDAEVKYIRKFDNNWSIVVVKNQVGFVLTNELYSEEVEMAQLKTKKVKKAKMAKN